MRAYLNPLTATRYHSLIVQEPLPDGAEATAYTPEGELMARATCRSTACSST
ncbi:MAG: hypothetical protein U0350_50265 [Caldilineaceae bacterium]